MLRLTRHMNMCVNEALECRILALRRRWYYCAAALLCTSLPLILRRVLSICKCQDPLPLFWCGIILEYALFGFQMPVGNFRGAVVYSNSTTIRSRKQHQQQVTAVHVNSESFCHRLVHWRSCRQVRRPKSLWDDSRLADARLRG